MTETHVKLGQMIVICTSAYAIIVLHLHIIDIIERWRGQEMMISWYADKPCPVSVPQSTEAELPANTDIVSSGYGLFAALGITN